MNVTLTRSGDGNEARNCGGKEEARRPTSSSSSMGVVVVCWRGCVSCYSKFVMRNSRPCGFLGHEEDGRSVLVLVLVLVALFALSACTCPRNRGDGCGGGCCLRGAGEAHGQQNSKFRDKIDCIFLCWACLGRFPVIAVGVSLSWPQLYGDAAQVRSFGSIRASKGQ